MTQQAVTNLMAARRYLTNVLLDLDVDSKHMTVHRLIELLDYFAAHPSQYKELTNGNEH